MTIMSRIGKQPIFIPKNVKVKIEGDVVCFEGPRGKLKQFLPDFFKLEIKDNQLKISVENPKIKEQKALWGTFARLISNMAKGVNEGFEKKLELVGVGYRAQISGNKLILNIGFSHPVDFLIPQGVDLKIEKNIISLSGADKRLIGETAAQIRRLRKPEPYKGKGIKYVGEVIREKAGKKAVTAAS